MISQEQLKKLLKYDPETGIFTNRVKRGVAWMGAEAGALDKSGYRIIGINGGRYSAQQLAFLYMTGMSPKIVDHKDRNPLNNKWSNLRASNKSLNSINSKVRSDNTTGVTGVIRKSPGYIARIGQKHIGAFDTLEEAATARKQAEDKLYD